MKKKKDTDTGRIRQMIEELEQAKEPLIFIVEVYKGGGTLKSPHMATETFYLMAGKALEAVNEAMESGRMGLEEAVEGGKAA